MSSQKISGGTVHRIPSDLRNMLLSHPKVLSAWEDITPLARNEWICLIEDAKREATRIRRLERTRSQLLEGKRRPCCWAGCQHR